MDTITCKECGKELETRDDCPVLCNICNIFICPDCGEELDGEYTEYCGHNCRYCGWTHCYGCI